MAKFIQGSSSVESVTKRRPDSRADKLQQVATEKADRLVAEYQEKVRNGDLSNATYREFIAKMNDIQQEFVDQLLAPHNPV